MTTDTRDARDTRQRLLDAASELFHSRSYHAVGVKDICDHAGVKRGSFYYFYPSKEALAIAVIERHWAVVVRDVLEPTLESDGPALERVLGFMMALHAWAERVIGSKSPIPGCPFANFAVELATQEEPIRMVIAGAFDRITEGLAETLDEAKADGDLPEDLDSEGTARALFATFVGGLALSKTHDDLSYLTGAVDAARALLDRAGSGARHS